MPLQWQDPDSGLHYRVTIRAMRVKDSHAMNRDRQMLAEKYEDDSTALLTYFSLPLLAHSSTLETSTDGDQWAATPLTEEIYGELAEAFVLEWLELVITINPQQSMNLSEALKKNLASMLGSATSLTNTNGSNETPSET